MAVGELIHPGRFDADRGGQVQINKATDTKVCMYLDEPGTFFTMSGHEVDDATARGAGFDVDGLRADADFLAAKRDAVAKLEVEFAHRRAAIDPNPREQASSRPPPFEIPLQTEERPAVPSRATQPAAAKKDKLRSTKLHEMKHRGHGQWDVFARNSDELLLEKVDEDTAIGYMLEQAEFAELQNG